MRYPMDDGKLVISSRTLTELRSLSGPNMTEEDMLSVLIKHAKCCDLWCLEKDKLWVMPDD